MKRILVFLIVFVALFGLAAKSTHASEGQFVLTNRVGEQSTCWFGSVLMKDQNYKILYSCRNLSYPGGTEVFSYVVWANLIDSDKPLRLGTLDLGKGEFVSKKAFSSLYVTKELNSNVKSPSGPVVMQGGLQPLSAELEGGSQVIVTEPDLISPTSSPVSDEVAKKSSSSIFRLGGILAFIILFVVVLMVILITRR